MHYCIAFSLAIILSRLQPLLAPPDVLAVMAILSVVAFASCRRYLAWRLPLAWLAGACAGFVYVNAVAAIRLEQQLPVALEQQDIDIEATVASLPVRKGRYQQYRVDVTRIPESLRSVVELETLLLNDYQPRQIRPCERWQFSVRLKRPHGLGNPAGFDYEAYLLEQGVQGKGYVRSAHRISAANGFCLHGIRQNWSDHVLGKVSRESAAWIVALTTGDKSLLNEEQNLLLQETGTTHLFVISGSHIALCAMAVWLLVMGLRRIGLGYFFQGDWRPFAALAALVVSAIYTGLAGYGVPSIRSLVMLTVFLGARIIGIETGLWLRYWVSMALVLLINPLSALNVGFVLSFGAVFVLILLLEALPRRHGAASRWQRCRQWLNELFWSQWFVFVGLLPFSLLYFSQVSFLAPLVNFVAVPAMSVAILPTLMLALFGWCIGADDFGLLYLASIQLQWLFDAMEALTEWCKARASIFPIVPFNHSMVAVLLCACLLLLLPPAFRTRWAGILLVAAVFASHGREWPAGQALQVDILDVDQGLAILVQTPTRQMLVDTGAAWPDGSMVGRAVKPFLVQQGIRHLDKVMVSHLDNDHAGGIHDLLADFSAGEVLAPEPLERMEVVPCRAGQAWEWEGVRFSILHPDDPEKYWKRNDTSCVLLLEVAGRKVLLPGDVEAKVEAQLLEGLPALDVMVAPHHGSKTSSTAGWVSRLGGGIVVFSSGYLSQFGHPHPDVQARYRDVGARAFVTGLDGMVTISVGQDGEIRAWGWREKAGKYWQKAWRRDNHS